MGENLSHGKSLAEPEFESTLSVIFFNIFKAHLNCTLPMFTENLKPSVALTETPELC